MHFYVILSRNVRIFGIMASLQQNGKKVLNTNGVTGGESCIL